MGGIILTGSGAAPPEERAAPGRKGAGVLLLIVDDEPGVGEAIGALLAEAGHRSLHVLDAQAGLDLLRVERVDLVLLDINLPGGLSGYAACETYRILRPDLPVILMSGAFTSPADARLAERVGASGFLPKPFTATALSGAIAKATAEVRVAAVSLLGFSCEECGAEGRVRQRGGEAVRVRCPNCGSIRVARLAELVPIRAPQAYPAPAALRRRILVADNAEHFRIYLLDLLTEAGHYVVTARGGQEALVLAQEWEPDLVLTDILLPGMDGLGLCQRIRAHPRLARTPLVVITTLRDPEIRTQAEAAGADLVLAKPIQPEEFLRQLHELIARLPW